MRDPVILIGAARSGTKILRDILAAGTGTATVPYDVNYIWRYGVRDVPHDLLDPSKLTERQAAFIRKALPGQAKAAPGDILIEKTVANTLRVPYVEAVLPGARYVHLIRDGRDVTESAMTQWQAPPDWRALWVKLRGMPLANAGYAAWFAGNFVSGRLKGRGGGRVWGPRYPGIDEDVAALPLHLVCARQWRACVEQARADLGAIPAERVFEIRYEDFIAGEAALAGLVSALRLPDPDAIVAAHRARVRPQAANRWPTLPEQVRAEVEAELAETLASLEYPPR